MNIVKKCIRKKESESIRERRKKENGITLIALIITVVVMLILAGVTISAVIDGRDLFGKTREASLEYERAVQEENDYITDLTSELDRYLEEAKEISDIYVALYTDGTLVFSNNTTDIDSTKVSKEYGNIKGTHNYAPWKADYENISQAKFLNEVIPLNTSSWFEDCHYLVSIDLTNLNTSKAVDMSYMFCNATRLASITGLENLNTSNATDMSYMFGYNNSLTSINVGGLDTENVINMAGMFGADDSYGYYNQLQLIEGLENFKTGNVIDMNSMFMGCMALTSLELSSFNTSNVTDMNNMFYKCGKLIELDLTEFNTSNVTNMNSMFFGCSGLTSLILGDFNTNNVTNMQEMFGYCGVLKSLDLSDFDTSNVTDMTYMFYGCSDLTTIYVSDLWTVENVSSGDYMFSNCTNLVGAISYSRTKLDKTYANYSTGYLTKKEENI